MHGQVTVIGAGLAGSECALQLAARGVNVNLYEMRPYHTSPAHHTSLCAELVCSNSLKSMREDSASGLLKHELAQLGSYVLQCAYDNRVSAGSALAVDREAFAAAVTSLIEKNPYIHVHRQCVTRIPEGRVVICAGPLCADELFDDIGARIGMQSRSFYDAAAPIVDALSINRDVAFEQSRYQDEHDSADYLNCPFEKDSYIHFYNELITAERTITKDFEQSDLFCACQPIEEVAKTGIDALRYGALKPVGIRYPQGRSTYARPYANVQLRAENANKTAYNLVGFQTNLTWPEQKRVFRLIPGLEHAEFFRYGVMHRNSFIDSPHVLNATFALPDSTLRFAGQITGTEGYVEAIASGLYAALNCYAELIDKPCALLPATSAFGSLVQYATSADTVNFQPMHVNFGLMPPLPAPIRNKKERYAAYAKRACADMSSWIVNHSYLDIPTM